jgi:NADPH:quinone reductase-like Zn-dependent oxidoreductase
MKAAVMYAPGEAPRFGDFAEPVVTAGRELAELAATGIHPVTRSLAEGRHYGSTGGYPLIPGIDAVARTADGTLLYTGYIEAPYGTLAERMAVSGGTRLPAAAEPAAVAGGLNPGLSSWMPLLAHRDQAAAAGEQAGRAAPPAGALGTVVILGVTGMAGLLAVQNARILGAARIIGAGRSRARLDRAAQAGATAVPLSGDQQADAAALAAALDGEVPGLVLDYVWGPAAEAMFAALGRRGLHEERSDISYIEIGALAGPEASVPAALLRSRRLRISGSGAGSGPVSAIMAQIPAYMQMIADGRVTVPTRTFPLSQVTAGWAAARDSGPRVVIVPG